jgi:RNA polymerase sigma-70 factor, ECF subfamily
VGGDDPVGQVRLGRGAAADGHGAGLTDAAERALRDAWWPAAAALARLTGDVGLAEDAVQDACAQALLRWPADGLPANPTGWLVAVARRRAVDQLRRESVRSAKEWLAVRELSARGPGEDGGIVEDDQLALLFACCHPAFDVSVRITLTLRMACGLTAAAIARLLLLPEATVAQRLVRARRKIRDAGIRLAVPEEEDLPGRLPAVLKTIYLTFTEGHAPSAGDAVFRPDLCDEALRLARALHRLLPSEPEATGLLALILLTAARSAARADEDGDLVLLAEQDRRRWNRQLIAEGTGLLVDALAQHRPGPYQLQAAIAACHAEAATAEDTDWRQIAALYGELLRFQPSPVIEANRAVAVAYAEGTAAGLSILETLAASSELAGWPQLHIARAALLARAGHTEDAVAAYRDALALEPAPVIRRFLTRQMARLTAVRTPPEDS